MREVTLVLYNGANPGSVGVTTVLCKGASIGLKELILCEGGLRKLILVLNLTLKQCP